MVGGDGVRGCIGGGEKNVVFNCRRRLSRLCMEGKPHSGGGGSCLADRGEGVVRGFKGGRAPVSL